MTQRPDNAGGPAGLADRLRRLPPLGVFLGTLALGLAAFFTPGPIGAVLVGLLAAGLVALLAVTWQHDPPATRAIRLLVLGVLVVIAASKLL
ncbi:MAG: hypothetical protein ACRDT6_09765 [Micromonosporaceae bacterium]